MSTASLLVERHDAVAILTIDDPPWNRMSLAFTDELATTPSRSA
jgi:enoyl-CoA hydratase/carnithine racemase